MTYPKKYVSPDGKPVLAKQAVHEAELVAQGYTLAAAEPPPAPTAPAGPETCAKCADLEAEVAKLKAQLAKVKEPKATAAAAKAKA
jgi:hypothetical protein